MATLLMRPADGGSADKKRRARKGKNAQKKQPQRGLGVAQLEKLRLQEQSLLCPASPAYSLRLCTPPSDHPMLRCENDLPQTMLSLNVHAQGSGGRGSSSGMVRGGEGGAVSRMSTLSGHSSAQSCLSPSVTVQDMNKGTAEAVDAAKRSAASRAFGCLSQASKFSTANASFFSNVLTTTQLQILDSQAQAQRKLAERRAATAGDQAGNAPAYIFPTISNQIKEGTVNDGGFILHPVFKEHVGVSTDIDKTNSTKELSSFQSYPSQQAWPTQDRVSGRKRPWLGLQESPRHVRHARALDLNSPAGESDAGHNGRHSPARLIQVPENRIGAHYTTGIVRSALGNSCVALGGKLKVRSSSSPWQDSDSPSPVSAYFSDVYPENGIGLKHCPSRSSVKDSCSSATSSSTYFTLNRKRCLNDPEIPSSLVEKESICSNFLTLGISSSSYPDRNEWNDPEESIHVSSLMSSNDLRRLNHQDSTTSGCEGDNHESQIRKSFCKQELAVLEGVPSNCLSLDYGGGNHNRRTSMLLCDSHIAFSLHHPNRFPSLPPTSMASSSSPLTADQSYIDHDPSTKSVPVEGDLDLSLRLAL